MRRPTPTYLFLKRSLDIAVAALALLVLAPVMLTIALLIYREDRSAPVLFRQRRTGFGGRTFIVLKFRTMVRDADALRSASGPRASSRGLTSGSRTIHA